MAEKKRRESTIAASDFLKQLGPGLITGASDDDPSGIGTYSQAGAQLGFSIGWTMLLTFPLMAAIQEISARIGRTTGHGRAGFLVNGSRTPAFADRLNRKWNVPGGTLDPIAGLSEK